MAISGRVTALLNAGGHVVGKDRFQASGRREGLKVPKSSQREAGFGSMTGPASGFDLRIPIMSGASILSKLEPMMGGACG